MIDLSNNHLKCALLCLGDLSFQAGRGCFLAGMAADASKLLEAAGFASAGCESWVWQVLLQRLVAQHEEEGDCH